MLSEPVVRMLFEHGVFTAADTAATAHALMWLALGLPAHVLVKALSPAFFARDDTLTPLLATLKGFAVAIVLALVLGRCVRRRRHRRQHRARRLEQRAGVDPRAARRRSDFRSMPRRAGGCRASSRRRLRWAGCCGWRRALLLAHGADAHGLAQAAAVAGADIGRNGGLRPASGPVSASPAGARRLTRSGKPPAARLAANERCAWHTTARTDSAGS